MFIIRALYEKVSDLKFDPWRIPDAFTPFDNEWKWEEETYKRLFTKIAETVPPDTLKDGKLNLLVIGPKSHGKSSFINSVVSLSANEMTSVANSGSGGESETVTSVYVQLNLPGDFKCFRLCDVSGLTKQESADTLVEDLKLLIDGHIKPGYEFDETEPISSKAKRAKTRPISAKADATGTAEERDADAEYYISEPTLENKIHGVIIVFDINEVYEIHIRYRNSLAYIIKKLHKMNIPISVVLTKADKLDPKVIENIQNIYYSKRVLTAVEKTEMSLGVPMRNIHPVVNFEKNGNFEWKRGLPILVAVRACLSNASNHLFSKQK